MVDFIRMGLLDIWAAQTDNYNKNFCTHWDSNTGPSAYEYSLSVVLLVEISIEYLNNTFYLSVLLNFTIAWYHVVDVVKYFVVYYILLTLYSQQTS